MEVVWLLRTRFFNILKHIFIRFESKEQILSFRIEEFSLNGLKHKKKKESIIY